MGIKVLIVDDHQLVREGLALIIRGVRGLDISGQAGDGLEAVSQAKKLRPDVITMDIAMPNLSGIDATRRILADRPAARILGLSAYSDRRYVVQMLKAGAAGYMLKRCASRELADAIRIVARGKTYLSPEIADTVVQDFRRPNRADDSSVFSVLTVREREILQLLVDGNTRKVIADKLQLSIKTIGSHVEHIMSKLKFRTLPELTKFAIREGLTGLE